MSKKKNNAVLSAMDAVAKLSIAVGVAPINKIEGCWEHQIDKHWWIALNGHKEPTKTSEEVEVEPFGCYVKFNGWPAGLFNPFGGVIAGGLLANEDTFIEAIENAIKQHKKRPTHKESVARRRW